MEVKKKGPKRLKWFRFNASFAGSQHYEFMSQSIENTQSNSLN